MRWRKLALECRCLSSLNDYVPDFQNIVSNRGSATLKRFGRLSGQHALWSLFQCGKCGRAGSWVAAHKQRTSVQQMLKITNKTNAKSRRLIRKQNKTKENWKVVCVCVVIKWLNRFVAEPFEVFENIIGCGPKIFRAKREL